MDKLHFVLSTIQRPSSQFMSLSVRLYSCLTFLRLFSIQTIFSDLDIWRKIISRLFRIKWNLDKEKSSSFLHRLISTKFFFFLKSLKEQSDAEQSFTFSLRFPSVQGRRSALWHPKDQPRSTVCELQSFFIRWRWCFDQQIMLSYLWEKGKFFTRGDKVTLLKAMKS